LIWTGINSTKDSPRRNRRIYRSPYGQQQPRQLNDEAMKAFVEFEKERRETERKERERREEHDRWKQEMKELEEKIAEQENETERLRKVYAKEYEKYGKTINAKQAAEILKVSVSQIRKLGKTDEGFPYYKGHISTVWFFNWLNNKGKN
jgi:hypothetical protein